MTRNRSRTPPPGDRRRIVLADVELAVETWGAGRPLLLLHGGMGLDGAVLRVPALVGLAGAGRQVVLFDQRGHGDSDRADPSTYTTGQWADDAVGLADALGAATFDLFGHSYGGFIALTLAVHHPDRVRRLVLAGTSAGPVVRTTPVVSSNDDVRAFYTAMWPSLFAGPDRHEDLLARLHFDVDAFDAAFRYDLPAYNLRARLDGLTMPTLLIAGDQDPYLPDLRYLAGRLPDARLELLPDAGHMAYLECPDAFRYAIASFLNG